MKDYINKIHCGDALGILKEMPDGLIDMVMTSPPYWGLRDYGSQPQIWDGDENCNHNFTKYNAKLQHENRQNLDGGTIGNPEYRENLHGTGTSIAGFCSKCRAWKGELGLEPDFNLYIKHLCDIFDEVKRVLKDTGTIWVNLGDTYGTISGGMEQLKKMKKDTPKYGQVDYADGYEGVSQIGKKQINLEKSLVMIPQRFAIEMVNRGWVLRNTIIWYKKNCMPSSAKDRFTVDFEYIYFFSKQKKYYFEQQFEEHLTQESRPDGIIRNRLFSYDSKENKMRGFKNKPTDKSDQHPMFHGKDIKYGQQGRNKRCVWEITTQPFPEAHFAVYPEELCVTPIKAGCKENGVVLDPFSGAGTTCLTARKLGRNYIGIEINKSYCDMAERRIHNEAGLL